MESPGPAEQPCGDAAAEAVDNSKEVTAEDEGRKDSAAVEEDAEADQSQPAADDDSTNDVDALNADHSAEERDLLCQSAEERELQARDASLCSENVDEDFLIMDEVHGDEEEEESSTKVADGKGEPDTEAEAEVVQSAKEAEQEQRTADYSSDDDDVIIEEPPSEKTRVVITMSDEEVPFWDPVKQKGNTAPGPTASPAAEKPGEVAETDEGADEDSVATESSGPEKAEKGLVEDADSEATQSSRDAPVANGSLADDGDEAKNGAAVKDEAECNGAPSLLKRPLSPDGWGATDDEQSKRAKSEDIIEDVKIDVAAVATVSNKKFVVMTQGELEKYVNARVQESLVKQEQTMLQPMEKKCDTLHRALERWRRRSFQLQKQLNEFVCEQEKCAGARKGRVSQRSVGVCVRMPPLRSIPPPLAPAVRTTVTSGSVVSSTPSASQTPLQSGRSSIVTAVTRGPTAPTVRVLTVPPPVTAGAAALSRLHPQTTAGTGGPGVPVPLQLIANTSSPTSQVKSVSLPVTTGSSTVVRTVTMVPTSTTVVTTSAGVKVIDLTQEEDASLAKLVAGIKRCTASGSSILSNKTTVTPSSFASGGGAVHKIAVPSSAIPVLSAAPTSLVQVSSVSAKAQTQVVGTSSTPTSTGPIRINQPVVTPQRVTYLLPNLTPNVVVNQREGAPRLANSTVSMPTILLRMTTPPNNLVPGNAISMSSLSTQPSSGGNLMVAPPGTQVRMIRAPTPVALQKGGNTFTLPPGTTVVRAPVTIPNTVSATVVTSKSDHGIPTQRVVVTGSIPQALEIAKHPAPLPPMPRYLDDPKKKRLPPKPALKITKAASGIVLSWNMTLNSLYADIQTYQLYAYQETSNTPSSSQWKKVGDVRALPLPMACTLTQFVEGHKYHFAVRAVDVHNRLGPFSEPSSILLK